jgi:hypothetical protein
VTIHATAEDSRINYLGTWIALNRSVAMVRRDLARGTVLHKTSGSSTLLLEHIVLLDTESYTLLEYNTPLVMNYHEESITKSTALQPRPLLTLFPASAMTDC